MSDFSLPDAKSYHRRIGFIDMSSRNGDEKEAVLAIRQVGEAAWQKVGPIAISGLPSDIATAEILIAGSLTKTTTLPPNSESPKPAMANGPFRFGGEPQ